MYRPTLVRAAAPPPAFPLTPSLPQKRPEGSIASVGGVDGHGASQDGTSGKARLTGTADFNGL